VIECLAEVAARTSDGRHGRGGQGRGGQRRAAAAMAMETCWAWEIEQVPQVILEKL
jgi:hypothetical protein